MVTIEQVIELDDKITKAVALIEKLKRENALLRNELETCRGKLNNVESMVSRYKDDQSEIEAGIKNAVGLLDRLLSDTEPQAPTRLPASAAVIGTVTETASILNSMIRSPIEPVKEEISDLFIEPEDERLSLFANTDDLIEENLSDDFLLGTPEELMEAESAEKADELGLF